LWPIDAEHLGWDHRVDPVSQTPMETFTIFITAANEFVELIHERRPTHSCIRSEGLGEQGGCGVTYAREEVAALS
jgi:hypothetical protein